jgi:hypothetical protein
MAGARIPCIDFKYRGAGGYEMLRESITDNFQVFIMKAFLHRRLEEVVANDSSSAL